MMNTNIDYLDTNILTQRETNLKCRQSLTETVALGDDISALASFDGELYT